MQQAEEADAKPEAERLARLGFVDKCRIVERELVERIAQSRILVGIDGKQSRVDHRLDVTVSGQGLGGTVFRERDRIADLDHARILEARNEIADLADLELIDRSLGRTTHTHFLDLALVLRRHEANLLTCLDGTVDDADERDDTTVGIEVRIEDEGLERCVGVALRRRDALDDGLEQVMHADTRLARGEYRLVGGNRETLLDLGTHALGVGGGQVDLVDDGNDLEVGVHGEQGIGDRLRLDTLGGIHDENRALACRQRARDLVGEIDVTRRVDEVELVCLAVVGLVENADGL